MRVVAALALALVLGACRREDPRAAGATVAAAEAPRTARVEDAGAPACPAVDRAKIAPFEIDRAAIKADAPDIVDPKATLASFHDRMLGLARGTGKRHVRIAVFGDSNLTSDYLTGHVRRALQARFGDGGHGFVALARPWPWYTHEDVHHHGTWPLFKQIAATTDPVPGHHYGLAHMAAESSKAGAAAWVATADPDAAVGRTASRFEIHFLKQPKGGSFEVVLDGKPVQTIATASERFEAGVQPVEAPDASHELRCVVKGDGVVRLFGATLERDAPSVVVDSLGTGAMNFQRFMMTEPTVRRAQLVRRDYDLVVVWLGMNSMWLHPNRAWVHDTITTIRDALPSTPVLMLTPPDSVREGEEKSDPRIVGLVKQIREVADETGVAFWDFRAAMGGDAAFLAFMRRGLASPDRAHLSKQGGAMMGQRLLAALFRDLGARLEADPAAGCPRQP